MYFQCAPQKSCELQPKIGTNFFKGKKVTLDPRPINLWGPPFLEVHTCPTSRCLTYFLEAPFVASKFEPPKWSKRLLYCSWCICIYILMCTYKYTIYIFFLKQFFIPSYFIRTGVSTFWKWAVFSPFCWDSGYLVNLRDFCYWPLWPSSLWQHGVSGVGKNLWQQNAWNHESSISENKNHPLNLNWKRKNMSCGCVCFILCFFIFFFADPKSLSFDSLLDFWFPNLAGLKSS